MKKKWEIKILWNTMRIRSERECGKREKNKNRKSNCLSMNWEQWTNERRNVKNTNENYEIMLIFFIHFKMRQTRERERKVNWHCMNVILSSIHFRNDCEYAIERFHANIADRLWCCRFSHHLKFMRNSKNSAILQRLLCDSIDRFCGGKRWNQKSTHKNCGITWCRFTVSLTD